MTPRQRIHRAGVPLGPFLLALLLTSGAAVGGCSRSGPNAEARVPELSDAAAEGGGEATAAELASLGEGFVVWESRRDSGRWRIWTRAFDGSPARPLTHEDSDRQHCCAHISPDGRHLAYLSVVKGEETYPVDVANGELRLLDLATGDERVLVGDAQTYYEHRAAVWRGNDELIYIGPDGRTRLLDLATGESTVLTAEAQLYQRHGWLIDPTLHHAVTGLLTSFATYDRAAGKILPTRAFGGCQGYFSQDGRWGFWSGGAGGPLKRIDLETGEVAAVIEKSDPRLPADRGYLYFPNLSSDGMLFTFAASHDEHHHFEGNYDVFVALSDPRTFELVGRPVRLSTDPGTDRFPDVHHAPLELGRFEGEAPFEVDLGAALPDPGPWSWDYGDGSAPSEGVSGARHTFAEAGIFEVRARRGENLLRAQVLVAPAAPPRPLGVYQLGERLLEVRFDEPLAAKGSSLRFASGRKIRAWRLDEGGRALRVDLAQPLDAADTLRLEGVADRATPPNVLPPTDLPVPAPAWPSNRDGLIWLWRDGGSPNRVVDPATGDESSCLLEYLGIAWLDHDQVMTLRDGAFTTPDTDAARVVFQAKKTNHLSLEMTLTPLQAKTARTGTIVALAGSDRVDFALEQRGPAVVLRLRTPDTGPRADAQVIELARLPARRPSHLVVTYAPGRLRAYLDGRRVLDSDVLQGGFFNWKYRPLSFGNDADGRSPWAGTLEGVAIYNRVMGDDEVKENHRRYSAETRQRPAVPKVRLRARLVAKSAAPTLEQIAPYREALVVYEYQVLEVVGGRYDRRRVRVAHPAILDRQPLPVLRREPGSEHQLLLEPFAANPQVESWFVSDTLDENYGLPLFYDVGR